MSHYFINDNNLDNDIKLIKINIFNLYFSFYTDKGVFSKDRLDFGTRLLLESLPKLSGKVLDLGCGYGIVGTILGHINSKLKIDMVDINERALILSRENLKLNKIDNCIVYSSDVYNDIKRRYNYIITNPPIRAGKVVVERFLFQGINYLEDNGELWFVMHKDHGVKTMIKKLEDIYEVDVVNKDNGFYIVRCKNGSV